jgi:hypothetical protein
MPPELVGVTRTEGIPVRVMSRTESTSVKIIQMLPGFAASGLRDSFRRYIYARATSMLLQLIGLTRTESISVRIIRLLPQLVGFLSVERACVKLDVFFQDLVKFLKQMCCESVYFRLLFCGGFDLSY